MEIDEEAVGDVRVVTARGRIDGNASGAFGERMQKIVSPDRPKVILDLSGVDFVTSAGLRMFLMLVKKVKAQKGSFALCAVQAPVREILEMTGFTGMIEIHPEREVALRAML